MLIYESGTIGTRPEVLPLSIGDGELAETAACVVPLPEIFSYYLQAGRVDVGFLGAAQIDRFGNLNSTVIGPYDAPAHAAARRRRRARRSPRTRARCFVMLKATPRSFVAGLDFRTSAGYLDGRGARERSRRARRRPARGDHGFRHADAAPGEPTSCTLTALFPGVGVEQARARSAGRCGCRRRSKHSSRPARTSSTTLRALHARTEAAHSRSPCRLPA